MSTWWRAALVVAGLAAILVLAPPATAVAGSWWSLLPPLVAITLALAFREVVLSLFVGVWLGATLVAGGNAATGFLRVIDSYARTALTDSDKISIIMFSMLLGGMVGVMSRSGGTHGVVRALEPFATTPRRAQVVAWLMGIAIFFDDYSNTLIVGNTMRPVTDSHRISREKLAYIVDSTAAPVACIALISTWVGYQVSLVGDALEKVGSHLNPFGVFLASIPFAFYPIFALAITLAVAISGRDWGPMLAAERRARSGELLAATSQPLADYESTGLAPDDDAPRRWWNAAAPVLLVVATTLVGLYLTGRARLVASGGELSLSRIIGASDAFTVLLWASQIGLVASIVMVVAQRILTVREALEAMVNGFKSMLMAFVVLTLAWSLGQVCTDLATAAFIKGAIGPHVPPSLLPMAIFLVAAAVSFATGTSWGTMAILTPLAIPLVFHATEADPLTLSATVSAILGGSVFGDHCSPISDTTILSSMASSCDHVDHVRTQLPYALLGAGIAVVVGYLPEAIHGLSPWLLLALGFAVIAGWMRLVARPV
ncbi:MAG: Na+/H+ antiporter NhaC family protein [Thermoanaerobaculales bacterium]|jgi:Na+/H+ antiporter NhaC|nr:Na+/H+ antiporter NhaC family protein [Thermoanaerobaculales bacterium]